MSMLRLFCYVLGDDPNSVFRVNIDSSGTISDLKEAIKAKKNPTFKNVDADMLHLWEVSITYDEIVENDVDANDFKDTGSLRPTQELSQIFSERLVEDHVHIVVKPPPVNVTKRVCPPSAEPSRAKRARTEEEDLESDDHYKELYQKLQAIDPEPQSYSDPSKLTVLPFPYISRRPVDRFPLKNKEFRYMGRKFFSKVWSEILKLRNYGGYVEVYIHGTVGYGKSHILAAVVCLLFRIGKRVVFIPDYRQMLKKPLVYIKGALLLAFADLPIYRTQIRGLASLDEAEEFCSNVNLPDLYFVVDQFDEAPANTDTKTNSQKHQLNKFIYKAAWRHYLITNALASSETMWHMKKDQTNDIKLSMMGGFDDEEMTCWWRHHQDQLPRLDGGHRARLEDLTGRLPLLLRSLLEYGGKDFETVEEEFLESPDFLQVQRNIEDFAAEKESGPARDYNRYLDILYCCMVEKIPDMGMDSDFDFRYFYRDTTTKRCRCTCGFVRKAASLLVWKPGHVPHEGLLECFEDYEYMRVLKLYSRDEK